MASVRVTINQVELKRLTTSRSREVCRHVDRLGRQVTNQAKRNVRVDEGTLRSTIHHTVEVRSTRVGARIGSPLTYGLYLHDGTGIYGPRRTPIVPVRAKFLRFEVKSGKAARGSRPVVYARSVKGVKGDKWLVRALRQVSPYPVRET